MQHPITTGETAELPVDMIDTPLYVRAELNQAHLNTLGDALAAAGRLEAIEVYWNDETLRYELIEGRHRLHVYRLLDFETIPAKRARRPRSELVCAECHSTGAQPKRASKRLMNWLVRAISGSMIRTWRPASRARATASKYTSVFPEPVTPSSSVTEKLAASTAARRLSTARSCASVKVTVAWAGSGRGQRF